VPDPAGARAFAVLTMRTAFTKVDSATEMQELLRFDRQIFRRADVFPAAYWRSVESYWMIVDGVKIGCCAFELSAPTLYVASTGILPAYQGRGFGKRFKRWQIAYARKHRYTRIVAHCRQKNLPIISLNQKAGFRTIAVTPGYYTRPSDAAVVMELPLI
jgi:ribosomal protein S18 acetylase RimI-like enzyme